MKLVFRICIPASIALRTDTAHVEGRHHYFAAATFAVDGQC